MQSYSNKDDYNFFYVPLQITSVWFQSPFSEHMIRILVYTFSMRCPVKQEISARSPYIKGSECFTSEYFPGLLIFPFVTFGASQIIAEIDLKSESKC